MRLQLSEVRLDSEEISAVNKAMSSGMVTMGEKVASFEEKFAEYIGAKHAVMVNSGSSANLLAMKCMAKHLQPGDEVFVPALSWSTTYWPIIQSGLKPVLLDCDLSTLNVGVEQLIDGLERYPKAKGLFLAHIMGNPAKVAQLMALSDDAKLDVMEDSCETLGSMIHGKKTGTFSKAGTFSFFYSHHMTTIEGGMIVTDLAHIAEWCRMMRSHGWSRAIKNDEYRKNQEEANPEIDPRFLFIEEGYNLRPTELNAAIGIQQLKKLDGYNTSRKSVEIMMRNAISSFGDLIEPITTTPSSEAYLFAFPVLIKNGDRNGFSKHLEANGIQTRPIVAGNLSKHPIAEGARKAGTLDNAARIQSEGLYWGLHPYVTGQQVHHLEAVISDYAKNRRAA